MDDQQLTPQQIYEQGFRAGVDYMGLNGSALVKRIDNLIAIHKDKNKEIDLLLAKNRILLKELELLRRRRQKTRIIYKTQDECQWTRHAINEAKLSGDIIKQIDLEMELASLELHHG